MSRPLAAVVGVRESAQAADDVCTRAWRPREPSVPANLHAMPPSGPSRRDNSDVQSTIAFQETTIKRHRYRRTAHFLQLPCRTKEPLSSHGSAGETGRSRYGNRVRFLQTA